MISGFSIIIKFSMLPVATVILIILFLAKSKHGSFFFHRV